MDLRLVAVFFLQVDGGQVVTEEGYYRQFRHALDLARFSAMPEPQLDVLRFEEEGF